MCGGWGTFWTLPFLYKRWAHWDSSKLWLEVNSGNPQPWWGWSVKGISVACFQFSHGDVKIGCMVPSSHPYTMAMMSPTAGLGYLDFLQATAVRNEHPGVCLEVVLFLLKYFEIFLNFPWHWWRGNLAGSLSWKGLLMELNPQQQEMGLCVGTPL